VHLHRSALIERAPIATVPVVFRRLVRAVLFGVASVFPSGDRERHWSEPVVQEAPPGDQAGSGQRRGPDDRAADQPSK
jgi:hypothetical protein